MPLLSLPSPRALSPSPAPPVSGPAPGARRIRRIAPLLLLPLLAACAPDRPRGDDFAALAAALESAPGIAPRLSVGTAFRRCTERVPPGGTIARADCPARRRARTGAVAALLEKFVPGQPARLRADALVDLHWDDARGKRLDASISSLRRAAELAERPAPVLADLAAALIVRAERAQSPRDLLEAYEAAERALEREPGNETALFNRALALDRFGLVDETARAWRAYLAADARSRWAEEARRRLRRAEAVSPPAPPPADARPRAYARYARLDPQGARELGMDRLLGAWGEAVRKGDARRAADRLARAAALGAGLERRRGGDAGLADAVRAIHAAAGDRAATEALARAHREYAAGRARFEKADYRGARGHFAAAEAASGASAALRGWARVYLGTTRVHNGEREAGERLLAAMTAADPARYPTLVARARWSLGNTRAQRDLWVSGLEEALESARLFARAGEWENAGAALNVATDAYAVLGEPDSAYASLHRALGQLRPYRGSVRLHNLLTPAARIVATDGLPRAALRLQDEGVEVAERNGNPGFGAEAYLARARLHAAAGDTAAAARDTRAARPRVDAVEGAPARPWLDADLREAEAMVSFRGDPARTTGALDSAAAYFGRIPLPFRTLPALVGGAEARLAARDAAGAAARLERALRLLEERRDSIRMEPRRAAVFEAFRGVVDRLTMLKLAEGRAAEALDIMDRGRASLASAGAAARHGTDGGVRSPPGEVAVEYARVADTLVMWTVAGRRVEVARAAIDTLRLARTLAALEAMLERRAGEAEVRPALSLLHDWLVRPLEGRLGGVGTPLVVVADGELTAVPFAALFDARRERYLMEDHPLRFAASLREARRPAAGTTAEGRLFVADPAFDRAAYPLLEPLEHARVEVRRIAEDYGSVTVLEGAAANLPAVMVALRRAGIVHFAGHAVFDDARPERSHLVLAPAPGRGGAGKVTAAELAEADLRHVRLVVLSACRTVRTGRARTAGYTGLAGALRAAGAGGVVGSTWDVDDRLTAALMPVFHQRYARSGDGPRALREAQLALLHSTDTSLRTPAAWAGFRYTGR